MSTDYLYARPSLWSGLARLLDLRASFDVYNEALTPAQADVLALRSDWQAVGSDLWKAVRAYENAIQARDRDSEERQQRLFSRRELAASGDD